MIPASLRTPRQTHLRRKTTDSTDFTDNRPATGARRLLGAFFIRGIRVIRGSFMLFLPFSKSLTGGSIIGIIILSF